MTPLKRKMRCAVYTRKSHEEGLEQEFNSLDAQREAGEAYVVAQKHEGWILVPDHYDDGGYSGGDLNRPALKRLLGDIQDSKVDVVVVYKIDRLTRSLLDFAQMIGIFEKHNVSFVSVTQQFNTTTSMGRLILNVLLSFAQFEREVTGERIRDKLAASKRKGMWMGGIPPLGYDVKDRRLVINEAEATIVRDIFEGFSKSRSITNVVHQVREKGYRTKTYVSQKGNAREGRLMDKGYIYKLIKNPIYVGQIVHKDEIHPGLHESIIDKKLWEQAHQIFKINSRTRANESRRENGAALRGIIKCGGCNSGMIPTSTRRRGKLYRYYTPNAHMKKSCGECPIGNISAGEIENVVLLQLQSLLQTPDLVALVWCAVKESDPDIAESMVKQRLENILVLWDELFPADQERLMRQLVERVVVKADGIEIFLHQEGLGDFARSLYCPSGAADAA
jgi:DNA invertase Pin-like site-specific DNA recombinase